jgi:Co/Zn/Cd efflux system component
MDAPVVDEVREVVARLGPGTVLRDLHVWRVARGKYACILCLETSAELSTDTVRRALSVHEELVHVTVELAGRGPAAARPGV